MRATVVAAGFVGFEILSIVDVFADAPQASSAAKFGTLGITFRARKPSREEEWYAEVQALRCETRFGSEIGTRVDWGQPRNG